MGEAVVPNVARYQGNKQLSRIFVLLHRDLELAQDRRVKSPQPKRGGPTQIACDV